MINMAFKIHNGRQMSDSFRTALFIVLSGGFQDAYTYRCRDAVFANAQTGNIVLMSSHMFSGDWGICLKYLIPVAAFILGTFVAENIHYRLKMYEKIHWRQLILIAEIIILFGVGFMPSGINTAANALVSFVCAMQVQTFHKIHGHAYASTMCIGNMRSGTEALCAYIHTHDKVILRKAGTYFGVILVFAIGAGIGSFVTSYIGIRSIWISCALLLISFVMMFFNDENA